MGPSYIALVDWIFGPHWVSFEQHFYANWDNVPIIWFFDLLSGIVPSSILQYVFLGLIIVLGLGSMYYCLGRFTHIWWIKILGSVLFVCNPWIYDRLFFGQVRVVAAALFLPVVVGLAWDVLERKLDYRFVLSLVAALFFLGMLNARYFPIGLLVVASFFGYRLLQDRSWVVVYYGLLVLIGSVVLSLYWILPLMQSGIVNSLYDVAQITFFAPQGSVGSLVLDTLSLNNSWMNYRTRALVSVDSVWWLPWIFAVIYAIFALIALVLRRQRGKFLLFFWAGFAAVFSTSTTLPIIGDINLWMITQLPFFSAYREPGKWLALLLVFYVIATVVILHMYINHRLRWVFFSLVTILVGASLYLFAFLPWQKSWTIQYPADWYAAKAQYGDIINSPSTIVFPWHRYLGCDFSDRRIMQNPAKVFFGADIIYGDNMEGGGVYSYSSNPLSKDLAVLLSDRMRPIVVDDLLAVLRYHNINHVLYFSTCASAPRYKELVDVMDVVYTSDSVSLLAVPAL